MNQTSFVGVIKVLFIISIIIMLARLFTRVLLPYVLRYTIQKIRDRVEENFRNTKTFSTSKKEKKPKSADGGEYIDFEEIE